MICTTVFGFLLVGWGALITILSLSYLVAWFVGLLNYLERGGKCRYACSWFYFSFDRKGFLLEFGNLDKPTAMFSIFYMTRGAFDDLETS